METETALFTPAPSMPHDDHRTFSFNQDLGGMTAKPEMAMEQERDPSPSRQTPRRPSLSPAEDMQVAPWLDTPLHVTDHGVPSNLRDRHSNGQQEQEPSHLPKQANSPTMDPTAPLERKESDAVIYNDTDEVNNGINGRGNHTFAMPQDNQAQHSLGPEVPSTPSHMELTTAAATPEHTTEEAFAMLKFNDSHCYVRSTNLVIGRDMNFLAKYQQQKKEDRRKRAREAHTRRALDVYSREPSQPSLMGDDDPSGESLEGRPEPTGPHSVFSVFSDMGGAVAYNNPYSDDENEESNRIRRRHRKNKSSSNTSVAPRSLMAFAEGENLQAENRYAADGTLNNPREWAQLPVHPPIPADIKKISREHLLFHYDADRGRWLLDVIGNGAIFNGTIFPKDTKDLELNHNDEIFIATLGMRFMLPDSVVNYESEPEYDEEDEDELANINVDSGSSISPARRLSNLFSADDSSDDDDEPLAQVRAVAKPPVPKIKLKFKKSLPKEEPASEPEVVEGKGKGKGKGKAAKSKDKSEKPERPEKPEKPEKQEKQDKKSEKKPAKVETKAKSKEESVPEPQEGAKTTESIRKPSDAAKDPASAVTTGPSAEQPTPIVPHAIDPTSVLANLAPDQLPEKRKGPGRPPKNGLLSKRDESGVKRKTKEFERRGVPVPALETLIAMVRQEQKAKDAANKAQARGEPIPDMPMPSIESSEMMHDGDRGRPQTPREPHAMESGSPGADRKLSPRLPRPIPREASPIKPMSEFTEEELKKPNMTYIYIIDEVLQNVEGGKADLQAIYDKIMKRWPFYKYKVGSLGWQSSVRHNLLSCDRFRDAGKSGKGKLWAINHDHPLDNKKRKPTPPPRPMQMPMQNGQVPIGMGQNQYGQPHYNGQYQQSANGQSAYAGKPGSYYSPYGSSGSYPPPGPNGMRQGSNGAYPANPSQPPQPRPQNQQPPAPPNPFQPVVDAIMNYRTVWLGALPADSPEYKTRDEAFGRGTNYFSNVYHGTGDTTVTDAEISGVEPFMTLRGIFEKHKYLFAKKPSEAAPATGQGSNAQPAKPEVTAEGSRSGPTAPHPAGQSAASNSGPAVASGQPAVQATSQEHAYQVSPNGSGESTHGAHMTGAADPNATATTVAANNIHAASSSSGTGPPTTVQPPSTTAAINEVPVLAPSAAPVPAQQQFKDGRTPSDQSISASAPAGSSDSQPLVSQQPPLPTGPTQPGKRVPAPSNSAPQMTPASSSSAVKPSEASAMVPAPPPPAAMSGEAPALAVDISAPSSDTSASSSGAQASAVGNPAPSAGTKRAADDRAGDPEQVDQKRPKLS